MRACAVRKAKNPQEIADAYKLIDRIYRYKGYIQKCEILPSFATGRETILTCHDYHSNELLGVTTIVYPAQKSFPSEYDFGIDIAHHLPSGLNRINVVEIKRLVKQTDLMSSQTDFVFLALMKGVLQYLTSIHAQGYFASLKPSIIKRLRKSGFVLNELEVSPQFPNCTEYLDGNYFTDPNGIPKIAIAYTSHSSHVLDIFLAKLGVTDAISVYLE